MRRGIRQAQAQRAPEPHKHTIPAWIGAPLWAIGRFFSNHWKRLGYAALVVAAFYLPYVLHIHAHTLKDAQCDRLQYATFVSYTYGCSGIDCTDDKQVYSDAMDVQLGLMAAGCYAKPPPRPDDLIVMITNALKSMTEADETETPPQTLVAEAT